jgi:hypothetical protein
MMAAISLLFSWRAMKSHSCMSQCQQVAMTKTLTLIILPDSTSRFKCFLFLNDTRQDYIVTAKAFTYQQAGGNKQRTTYTQLPLLYISFS